MAKLSARQVILALLVFLIFAPVFLSAGAPEFRPAWLLNEIGGVPLYPLGIAGLIVVFVILAWVLSREVFGGADNGVEGGE